MLKSKGLTSELAVLIAGTKDRPGYLIAKWVLLWQLRGGLQAYDAITSAVFESVQCDHPETKRCRPGPLRNAEM